MWRQMIGRQKAKKKKKTVRRSLPINQRTRQLAERLDLGGL